VLIPREHGAYGQLAFPLATALAIGRPTPGAIALAVAGVAAFLVHESLLVFIGQRGSRAAREQRPEALRTLLALGALAAIAGVSAVVTLNPLARWALTLPAVLTLQLGVAVFSNRERTIAGEMLAAATLTSLAVPVALGSGVTVRTAFTVFVVFALIFFVATTTVHAILERGGRGGETPRRLVAGLLTFSALLILVALVRIGFVQPVAPWAALPVSVLALFLAAHPPSPRHLRIVGWTLVTVTAATSIVLIAALR
jgi:hypothetical protein